MIEKLLKIIQKLILIGYNPLLTMHSIVFGNYLPIFDVHLVRTVAPLHTRLKRKYILVFCSSLYCIMSNVLSRRCFCFCFFLHYIL